MNSGGSREQEAERGLLRSQVWETLLELGEPPRGDQQELGVGAGERSDHQAFQCWLESPHSQLRTSCP